MTDVAEYEATFDTATKVWQVFCVLRDMQWHCREHEYAHTSITQIAGGSGIQGLQRGTGSRPGLLIDSGDHLCTVCGRTTRQDRWTGNFAQARPSGSMPQGFANMSDDDIRAKFQLLKASNGSVSHNLLKSRACERCYKTGNRGTPMGIRFFYAGDGKWAPAEADDASGCVGCGWHDFEAWRNALNAAL